MPPALAFRSLSLSVLMTLLPVGRTSVGPAYRLLELGHRHYASVPRQVIVQGEPEPRDVLGQAQVKRARGHGRRRVCGHRRVRVGLDQELLLRELDPEQAECVEPGGDVLTFARTAPRRRSAPTLHFLTRPLAPRLRQPVRSEGSRSGE